MNLKIAFFASHNGSNMQAVVDACRSGRLNAVPAIVISNNSTSGALAKAKAENIPGYHLSAAKFESALELDEAILAALVDHDVNLIVLAGYMKLLPEAVISKFRNQILNIHPALLPRHGGRGFYGERVHRAVLDAGDLETGVTIHLVNEEYDSGRIIAQTRLAVEENDSVESLSRRVLAREHQFLVETLIELSAGRLQI